MEGGGGISTAAVYFKSRYEIPSPKMKSPTRMVTQTQNLTANALRGLGIRWHPTAALTLGSHESFCVRATLSSFPQGRIESWASLEKTVQHRRCYRLARLHECERINRDNDRERRNPHPAFVRNHSGNRLTSWRRKACCREPILQPSRADATEISNHNYNHKQIHAIRQRVVKIRF